AEITKALDDRDPAVRQQALRALKAVGAGGGDPDLEQALRDATSANPQRRADGLNRLASLPPAEARQAERPEVIGPCLKGPEPAVRRRARRALFAWAARDSAPLVAELLDEEDYNERYRAIEVLGRLQDPRAAGPLLDRLRKTKEGRSGTHERAAIREA